MWKCVCVRGCGVGVQEMWERDVSEGHFGYFLKALGYKANAYWFNWANLANLFLSSAN